MVEAMLPYFSEKFGNAGSRTHDLGREAAEAVARAREQVAALLGAAPAEIVFTSGATESNNLAIFGALALRPERRRVLTTPLEHPAVVDALAEAERRGRIETVRLPVGPDGCCAPASVDETFALVTVMAANNEIGTFQPLRAVAEGARGAGALVHSDATQAVGKVRFDVGEEGVDLASLTGHKLYGPKGAGALYVREGIELPPHQFGGGQERGMRPGTHNVPGIVGLGAACELCRREREEEAARTKELRDRLRSKLFAAIPGLRENGDPERKLPQNLSVIFPPGRTSADLIARMPELCVSAGAACHSGGTVSPTLQAIGLRRDEAERTLRFGVGRHTTAEEIDAAAAMVIAAVRA